MTTQHNIEEAKKKAFEIRKKICDGIWLEKWKSNECEEKEIELMSTALLNFNSERIAELERENERLKNHIGESNKMVCNTKKPMYFQMKQKVREVGRIIGCGDEKSDGFEDDKMMELEKMFSDYFGIEQLQKEKEELKMGNEMLRLEVMRKIEPPKEKSYGWEQVALEELKENNKLKKENSELRGKVEFLLEIVDKPKQTLSELKGKE